MRDAARLMRVVLTLLVVCPSGLTGCATATKSGFLQDYHVLGQGKYIESFWLNPAFQGKQNYSTMYLDDIDVQRISNYADISVDECRQLLRTVLTSRSGTLRFTDAREGSQAKLQLAITEMTPGRASARVLAGEFGFGHAWVQVEGRVTDMESGATVATFVDRRRASGMAGLEDLSGDAGPDLARRMIREVAEDLTRELEEALYAEMALHSDTAVGGHQLCRMFGDDGDAREAISRLFGPGRRAAT